MKNETITHWGKATYVIQNEGSAPFKITVSGRDRWALVAATVLIEMPEIGTMTRKQAASLTGVAPMTRQSASWRLQAITCQPVEKWQGKSFIQGGRKTVREALYMPALVAARFNPDLKAKYVKMVAAGNPPKIALTALMRKLIEAANALIKADRLWIEKCA